MTDTRAGEYVAAIRRRLEDGLGRVDPHHRLQDRPVSYRLVSARTVEIVYRDVPRIDEAEVSGIKRLIGEGCYCSVQPQTAETLTVRFVVPVPEA